MDYKLQAEALINYLINKEKKCTIDDQFTNITKGEKSVLLYLSVHEGVAYPKQISEHFNINTSRVAAIINAICKKGYAERVVDSKDKRKTKITLTASGEQFCNEEYQHLVKEISNLLAYLGEEDTNSYIRITKKIAERRLEGE